MDLSLRVLRAIAIGLPPAVLVIYETLRHALVEPLPAALLGNAVGGLLIGGVAAGVASLLLARVERAGRELARAQTREAVLQERQRLAAALHDDVAQVLFWTGVRIGEVEALLRAGQIDAVAERVATLRRTVEAARARLRETIHMLRENTRAMASEGFWGQVSRLAAEAGLRLTGDALPPSRTPGPPATAVEDALGVVREAFSNVAKHAGTREVRVRVQATDSTWRLEIADGGRGFAPEAPTAGLGLLMMSERAARAGGELRVDSAPGRGTRITLLLPLNRAGEPEGYPCAS